MTKIRLAVMLLLACAIAVTLTPVSADAQDEPWPFLWDVTRGVLRDPTTYAPATLAYTVQRVDWKSSQVFFDHGWLEQNPRFTVSGRPNDVAISYRAGVPIIGGRALAVMQASVVNNLAAGVVERILRARYPTHKKWVRAASWVERITFASYVSYLSSADHLRQISKNRRMKRQLGY